MYSDSRSNAITLSRDVKNSTAHPRRTGHARRSAVRRSPREPRVGAGAARGTYLLSRHTPAPAVRAADRTVYGRNGDTRLAGSVAYGVVSGTVYYSEVGGAPQPHLLRSSLLHRTRARARVLRSSTASTLRPSRRTFCHMFLIQRRFYSITGRVSPSCAHAPANDQSSMQ